MNDNEKSNSERELTERLRAAEEEMNRPGIDAEKAKDLLALHARLTAELEKIV